MLKYWDEDADRSSSRHTREEGPAIELETDSRVHPTYHLLFPLVFSQ